jgi:predicted P-loop ATPase
MAINQEFGFIVNNDGTVKSTYLQNVVLTIENDPKLKGAIRLNEWTQNYELAKSVTLPGRTFEAGIIPDDFTAFLRSYIESEYETSFKENLFPEAYKVVGGKNPYNPVKERVTKTNWDGVNRIDRLFQVYYGADDHGDYTTTVARRFFAVMMDRIFKPGGKYSIVPVLTGEQGYGKSTLANNLFPDNQIEIKDVSDDKRLILELKNAVVVEFGEMAVARHASSEKLKSTITQTKIVGVPMYGRGVVEYPAHNVFIGTGNFKKFLNDPTGNRRFFPIELNIDKIEKDITKEKDEFYKQLLAEAYQIYTAGEKLYFDTDELKNKYAQFVNGANIVDELTEQVNAYTDLLFVPFEFDARKSGDEGGYIQNTRWLTDGHGNVDFEVVETDQEILVKVRGGHNLKPVKGYTVLGAYQTIFTATRTEAMKEVSGKQGKAIRAVMDNNPNLVQKKPKNKTQYHTKKTVVLEVDGVKNDKGIII